MVALRLCVAFQEVEYYTVGVWGCRRYSKLPCRIFPGLCHWSRVVGIELFFDFLLVLSLAGRQILNRTFVWKVCRVACHDQPFLIFKMSKSVVETWILTSLPNHADTTQLTQSGLNHITTACILGHVGQQAPQAGLFCSRNAYKLRSRITIL